MYVCMYVCMYINYIYIIYILYIYIIILVLDENMFGLVQSDTDSYSHSCGKNKFGHVQS